MDRVRVDNAAAESPRRQLNGQRSFHKGLEYLPAASPQSGRTYAPSENAKAKMTKRRLHPSMAYAHAYENADTIFGTDMTADFLISRIRSFSWEGSYCRLADLASVVAQYGPDSETVRRLTVDPLARLTGDARAAPIVHRARRAVASRRNEIVLAHEEAISFLQHLAILEGGDGEEIPGDPELSLWLGGVGSHLGKWQREDEARSRSVQDGLIATMAHGFRFNNELDPARTLVRASMLFAQPPQHGDLADPDTWRQLEEAAFGGPYQDFLEGVLGPLFMLSRMWGDEASKYPRPAVVLGDYLKEVRIDPAAFTAFLDRVSSDRETIRDEIRGRIRADGLPHAPTALLHHPFIRTRPGTYVAASPWAVQLQVRTGVWALFLNGTKRLFPGRPPDVWFRAFGGLFENWCRLVATEAARSPFVKVSFHMPARPGGEDEVEDVVLIEGSAVVLFSVKARVMDRKAAREAVSVGTTMKWYEDFFFEEKGDDYRGGAVRLLDRRIARIRAGEFEAQGVRRNASILPVVVTYDTLGESDLLYRWLEQECSNRGLLQDGGVSPMTLARVDEFEQLMAHAADGRSVVKLLRRREHADRHRRLDQILGENPLPRRRRRLPFLDRTYQELSSRIVRRLFTQGPQ